MADSLREIAEQLAEPCVFWCGEQDYTKEGYADSIAEAFTKALVRAMRLAIEATHGFWFEDDQDHAKLRPIELTGIYQRMLELMKAEAKK